MNAEHKRLEEERRREQNWKRWGPYLSERQWGTVREDYSENGTCWEYFPHDHSRSRAYRWGEDGLLGICDRECRLCFAVALWNGHDPILKERLFGVTNSEGNHGEDVKELYAYLDSTPTHSYMKAIYRYPQQAFPYQELLDENRERGLDQSEYELADTGIFNSKRYFDVVAEYAKADPNDILIQLTVYNRGPERAQLHILPTLWFRNTWIWGCRHEGCTLKPRITPDAGNSIRTRHQTLDEFSFYYEAHENTPPDLLFTENDTDTKTLFGEPTYTDYVKSAFHNYVINRDRNAVNPSKSGTKTALYYLLGIEPGQSQTLRFRLCPQHALPTPFENFGNIFDKRKLEADRYYDALIPPDLEPWQQQTARLAYAGLLWSKQFYHVFIEDWLRGDPFMPPPPAPREMARNHDWPHLFCRDVLSMPDKWEYPWFAAWDLAFHMVPFARIDATFAKKQLGLLLREWYMHPNGQLPAYEFNFNDVNPPVHAWACWQVFLIGAEQGHKDYGFLASSFQKLLLNFTWWVNRKDAEGRHIFSGGFLGLDNIGVFDRSKPLPGGGSLEQADATAWMAFYAGTMLAIALELAEHDPVYEDMASKFFEHFIAIADAMNNLGGSGLWDDQEGFYYDRIRRDEQSIPLKIRSTVGLIPLIAVQVIHAEKLQSLPGFHKRTNWFIENRKDLTNQITFMQCNDCSDGPAEHILLAIPSRERLARVLSCLFDEGEFLAPFGFRSLSKKHQNEPFRFTVDGVEQTVDYVPGESNTWLFGGNSNWRGPIWFPINFLLIEALDSYHHFYGDSFKLPFPTGSGNLYTLGEIADQMRQRLTALFRPDANGRCPHHGNDPTFADDPNWHLIKSFHEYFHGDNGRGIGASHQTGWTALVASCIHDLARNETP